MELHERIRLAREKRGFTQKQIADHFGIKPVSVTQWESGKSRPDAAKFGELAKLLEIPLAWLISGDGPTPVSLERTNEPSEQMTGYPISGRIVPGADLVGNRDLPVYAAAAGGDGHMIVTFDPVDYVKRPFDLENVRAAYAILIAGDSMDPAYRHGDMALVNPTLQPKGDEDHILYDTEAPQGTAEGIVKRLVGWSDRKWKLKQFNPPKQFEVAKIDWPVCHRVTGRYNRR